MVSVAKYKKSANSFNSLDELHRGDYVVHKTQKDLSFVLEKVLSEIIGMSILVDLNRDAIAIENLRELTEKENFEEVERAIDEIIEYDCLEGEYDGFTRVMIDNKCYDRYEILEGTFIVLIWRDDRRRSYDLDFLRCCCRLWCGECYPDQCSDHRGKRLHCRLWRHALPKP